MRQSQNYLTIRLYLKKKKKKVNHVKEPVSQKSGKELTRGNLISINTWQIPQRR